MYPHKFIYGSNTESVYQQVVFCEYCGHIAFQYAIKDNDAKQEIAKQSCPLSSSVKEQVKKDLASHECR